MRTFPAAGAGAVALVMAAAACSPKDSTAPLNHVPVSFDLVGGCPRAPGEKDSDAFLLLPAIEGDPRDQNGDGAVCQRVIITGNNRIQVVTVDNNVPFSTGKCRADYKLVLKDEAGAADVNGNGMICKKDAASAEEATEFEDDAS